MKKILIGQTCFVGGYSTKFYTGRLRPEVQPLTFYVQFLTKRYLFHILTVEWLCVCDSCWLEYSNMQNKSKLVERKTFITGLIGKFILGFPSWLDIGTILGVATIFHVLATRPLLLDWSLLSRAVAFIKLKAKTTSLSNMELGEKSEVKIRIMFRENSWIWGP